MVQWWTPEQSETILGYAGATVGLCWALVGVGTVLADKGRGRPFVLTMTLTMTAVGTLVALAGLVALVTGQPGHVAQPLALGGGLVTVLGVITAVLAERKFEQGEQRKMDAAALRRG